MTKFPSTKMCICSAATFWLSLVIAILLCFFSSHQIKNLGIVLLITLVVWRYYRRRTSALTERYSTFGPRFWTGSVDSCVLWPITFITSGLLALNVPRIAAAILVVVESLTWLLYTVVMHA